MITILLADQFIDYFKNFTDLEEISSSCKKNGLIVKLNPLDDPKEYFLNQDIHPNDMEFDIRPQ